MIDAFPNERGWLEARANMPAENEEVPGGRPNCCEQGSRDQDCEHHEKRDKKHQTNHEQVNFEQVDHRISIFFDIRPIHFYKPAAASKYSIFGFGQVD